MDRYLLAWARRVKARDRNRRSVPPLWLFTDGGRMADPLPAIGRMPRGLCGVVFRHDDAPGRLALGRAVARACRSRALLLSVAGDWRLAAALGAGVHLRGGRRHASPPRWMRRLTASAHTVAEARRGRAAGVAAVFISPLFATGTHPHVRALGVLRWQRLAREAGAASAALGGIAGMHVRRLPARCKAAGGIDAFMAE